MIELRVIGVDAGGTRTRAAFADSSGRVLGRGVAGPANVQTLGVAAAAEAIRAAVRETGVGPLVALAVGAAGAGGEEERTALREALADLAERVLVTTDLHAALHGAHPTGAGLVLVAGTGSACLGRDAALREARAGGLGAAFDDAGSAVDLVRAALGACARASDGRTGPTLLAESLGEVLGPGDWRTRLARAAALRADELAALAPHVLRAAAQGDRAANSVVDHGARELGRAAAAVARELGLEKPAVALGGGLLAGNEIYGARVLTAVRNELPGARVFPARNTPLFGALLLAFERAGVPLEADPARRLEAQLRE